LKRIVFSDEAKNDIRAIPQQIAMNILAAIHRRERRIPYPPVKNRKDAYR